MAQSFEFFFDFSCPFAYIASQRVRDVARRHGNATVELRPVLLGGIFNSLGHQPMATYGAAKQRHNLRDMERQAALHGVPFAMPDAHPMRTVDALRMLLAAPREQWWPLIDAIYRAYWVDGRRIDERDTLRQIADEAGLDGAALVARIDDPEIKTELRTRTDRAVELGLFGVPTFIVDGELFWGQDRLSLVGRRLNQLDGRRVDFWFDFSSPFAYMGAEIIGDACHRHGATLAWRPMLLGAVFKQVEQVMVPLQAMPPAKQQLALRDMNRFAELHRIPFQFPSRFPMMTVAALRLVLAVQEQVPEKTHAIVRRIFRAYWGEDQDINDKEVLAECCRRVELDPAPLLDACSTDAIKQALFAATSAAVDAGVFGAPAFQVDGGPVIWGQDRVEVVEALLEGRIES